MGCYIQAVNGIEFGKNVYLGPNTCIISANHDPSDYSKHIKTEPIKIGDNVWIGANCVILPSVKIGNNTIIGAGSIVVHNISPNSIAVGNPCRVVKTKPTEKTKLKNKK